VVPALPPAAEGETVEREAEDHAEDHGVGDRLNGTAAMTDSNIAKAMPAITPPMSPARSQIDARAVPVPVLVRVVTRPGGPALVSLCGSS